MVPLSEVPFNSFAWLVGCLACYLTGYRCFLIYRESRNELSKYIAWFGLIMGTGQAILAVGPFLTQNVDSLRGFYLAGEFFVYASMIAQAAILWCLILRARLPVYAVTLPVAVIGLASWLYGISRSTLQLSGGFITYRDPLASAIVLGVILVVLFVPVGLYFLRAAATQTKPKAIMMSVVLGLVYIGIGVSTGGLDLLIGQVMTPASAIGDLSFFSCLLVVMLWPHRASAKAPAHTAIE